jgi:hypothetical protein
VLSTEYHVEYDDGLLKGGITLPRPERLPQPGDVYVATDSIWTISPAQYVAGDRFEVMERTHFAPHHRRSSLGNLVIRCRFKKSVWSCFDAVVATGCLRLEGSELQVG